MTETLAPYELVEIATGKRWTPARMEAHYDGSHRAYAKSDLRKDGEPSRHGSTSWVVTPQSRFLDFTYHAAYDAERETRAQPIRDCIKSLQTLLADTQSQLLALYAPQTIGPEGGTP